MNALQRLSDWARVTGGEWQGDDICLSSLSIDTRKLEPGQAYLAIRGERFDGNDFVAEAERCGASALIVERWVDSGLPQVKVADGRLALGYLAKEWRTAWGGIVIGITGSNGKTTVKELVAALLAESGAVWKTQGNFNNDIGVPLTLLQLREAHRYAAIEMGANHPGEIDYVAQLAMPNVAIISNAGPAHLEGFGSVEGVAKAKGELLDALPADGIALLNVDDPFHDQWRERAGSRRVLRFGFSDKAEVRAHSDSVVTGFQDGRFHTRFTADVDGRHLDIHLPLCGRHNVRNALAALAVGHVLGLDDRALMSGMMNIARVSGRFQPLKGQRNMLLIDDTYNANPASVEAALAVLADWPGEAWMALGSLGELGDTSPALHAALGHKVRAAGVTRLLATGPDVEHTLTAFGAGARYCSNQADMIEHILNEPVAPAILLIKGSRSQQMERVVAALREQDTPCY
ncbi:MAG: UDP-N-acetylmuramoyl-tripeptide--D-alanyl-D-alanine ligase [Methylococcaceae bacterium]